MKTNELQDFIDKVTEIKNRNKEDFNKLKYIVDGVLLAQNKEKDSVEKAG